MDQRRTKLRTDLTCDALLHGAGYAHVVRIGNGTAFELHRIEPGKVARKSELELQSLQPQNTSAKTCGLSRPTTRRAGEEWLLSYSAPGPGRGDYLRTLNRRSMPITVSMKSVQRSSGMIIALLALFASKESQTLIPKR